MTKHHLSIDIETRSRLDLADVGVYKYAENCEIILFSYCIDFAADSYKDIKCVDLLHGGKIPDTVIQMLTDKSVVKHAYNAQFERVVLSEYLHEYLEPEQWFDTMLLANYLALPSSLKEISEFLFPNLKDHWKDSRGRKQLAMFSKPKYIEPDLTNPKDLENWKEFKCYNQQDVITEMRVYRALSTFLDDFPDSERRFWYDDQKINDRGVRIDRDLVNAVIRIMDELSYRENQEFQKLTGGLKPTQNKAFAKWLSEETGVLCNSVSKENLAMWYSSVPLMPEKVDRAIKLKKLMSKTSLAKYKKMRDCVCEDGRARGLFKFYGASRTGRFSGALVQLQNLKRNTVEPIEQWRKDAMTGDLEYMEMLTDDVPDVLSQLVRTAIIPRDGYEFIVSDFHAIEAVISAWIAGEKWRLDVFRGDGRIYEASASQMFNVPVNTITKPDGSHGENYYLRAKGKVAELALGYGGGLGALQKMGGEKLGLTEEEMRNIVYLWRVKSPNIVAFWEKLDSAFRSIALGTASQVDIYKERNIVVRRENEKFVSLQLPSLRKLYYYEPHLAVVETPYGVDQQSLMYWGKNQTTGHWERIPTRGSKLFENLVQATARDILVHAIHNIRLERMDVVMHIHDEAVLEVPKGKYTVDDINLLMTDLPSWATAMPLTAAGFKADFYMKD